MKLYANADLMMQHGYNAQISGSEASPGFDPDRAPVLLINEITIGFSKK